MENFVVQSLYEKLIDAWDNRDAEGMACLFAGNGVMIGFDGSVATGPQEVLAHTSPVFASHPTPPFIKKVKEVRMIGADAAMLRAIAGMVPPGKEELAPELNAHQTLVAAKQDGEWKIELFQNTPAQFHGRPELVEEMTEELIRIMKEA
ncbi:SgcJ/EcaC family oxidoreductase [Bacillus sp. FJAT-27445]|uniref:SgcJ/EcaC family oxidoreductase n=1 Tax=Bacillus sp. FJAT-27445 TaxID=1679166 RepID=UPI000B0515D5|nr:SgcJ/EcaC family oxidoreductase [Bacillus sp. FJAT-27445]